MQFTIREILPNTKTSDVAPSIGNRDVATWLGNDGNKFCFVVAFLAGQIDLTKWRIKRAWKLGKHERFFWQTVIHLGGVGFVVDADCKYLSWSWHRAVEFVGVESDKISCFGQRKRRGKTADFRPKFDARHRLARQFAARKFLDIDVFVQRVCDKNCATVDATKTC